MPQPNPNNYGSGHDRSIQRADAPTEFTWTKEPEPHVGRRREILKKYPQIKELYQPDPVSAIFGAVTVVLQIVMCYLVSQYSPSWLTIAFLSYWVGGFQNHSMVLGQHELTHDLWFKTRQYNVWMGFVMNLTIGVPMFRTFKRYHLDHHAHQGSDELDTDIATDKEGIYIKGKFMKAMFVLLSWLPYGLRPVQTKPKPIIAEEVWNYVICVTFDIIIYYFFGWKSFAYMILSTVLGLGLHPMSGHFVGEHTEVVKDQETYSYYGPLNYLAYNVGYHNEHHDFPRVPGRFLPKIKEIAPEYYDMPNYSSWVMVLYNFIMNDGITCFCRVKRA